MNDTYRDPPAADLSALAQTVDANGNLDLTAYQAQRLILHYQSIDGLDAKRLVHDLATWQPYEYKDSPEVRDQLPPLLEAIGKRLPPEQALRFASALDAADVTDNAIERGWEWIGDRASEAWKLGKQGVEWADGQISDHMASAKRWADTARDNPENSYIMRAAGALASAGVGEAQENYGRSIGATKHALNMLGDTIDLGKLAYNFATDENYRKLLIGAAKVYAAETWNDPNKPVDDVRNIANKALEDWEKGYDQARRDGKEREYFAKAEGAAGIEILATIVPVSKLAKFGKLARIADVAEDVVPDSELGRKAAADAAEALSDVTNAALRGQRLGGVAKEGGDQVFDGLAGIKRSQAELKDLVDDVKKAGTLDGLLRSGALSPKELGYLARQDIGVFDGQTSINDALGAYVKKNGGSLDKLNSSQIGDIGEAMTAHKLAKDGYTDIQPIQNNSGHGSDLVAISPAGKWEVFEVKASANGIAKGQTGEPMALTQARLQRADAAEGLWAPKNMWEQEAAQSARRILKEAPRDTSEKLDITAKWSKVNIEFDPKTGELKGTPEIDPWLKPQKKAGLDSPISSDVPTLASTRSITPETTASSTANLSIADAAPTMAVAPIVLAEMTPRTMAPSLTPAASASAPGSSTPQDHQYASATPTNLLSPDRQAPAGPGPQGAMMVEQLRESIANLDRKADKPWDRNSDLMLASAYKLTMEAGFKPGDKIDVLLSKATDTQPAGATLFVARSGPGASPDPFANRAQMPTSEALAGSPEQKYQDANMALAQQEQSRLRELAESQTRSPDDPSKGSPKMSA